MVGSARGALVALHVLLRPRARGLACHRELGRLPPVAIPDIRQRDRYRPRADARRSRSQYVVAVRSDRAPLGQLGRSSCRGVPFQRLTARDFLPEAGLARQRDGDVGTPHAVPHYGRLGLAKRRPAHRIRDPGWIDLRVGSAHKGKRGLFRSGGGLRASQPAARANELPLRSWLLVVLDGLEHIPLFSVCHTQERAVSYGTQLRSEYSTSRPRLVAV